ncbi:MAG: AMP-binding protein [Myxococcales bacterium]|nr:AMP-binding protein [Myxococcales bacterium]
MPEIAHTSTITFPDGEASWSALLAQADTRLGAPTRFDGQRVVFVVDTMREAFGAIIYGLTYGLDYGVVERHRVSPEVAGRFAENRVTLFTWAGATVMGAARDLGATPEPGRVTVLTSGTTGLLKLIPHSWDTLNTFDRVAELPDNTWFLPYQIGSYAWFQMVSLGLFKPKQDLICGDFNDLAASFEAALRTGRITAISSTPTFWRHALMNIGFTLIQRAPLRSISMGGEIVDQAILDELSAIFPEAKIRHIYASSEAGAAIIVTDGMAGFHAKLTEPARAIGVKVAEGRLFIRSPYSNKADGAGWVDTGDIVERRGDRYLFCGRAGTAMINVGGQKAFAPDIEAYLNAHPNVLWSQVTARRAPLVGNLPVARVVMTKAADLSTAERDLTAYCSQGLADYAVPRMWEFLDDIPMRASLKS